MIVSANCNFDQHTHLCQWKNLRDDDFDWTLHNGPTVSTGTGPSVDHTTGTKAGIVHLKLKVQKGQI
jgi:hypothetical protein